MYGGTQNATAWTFDSISNMFYTYKLNQSVEQSARLISLYTIVVILLNFVMGYLQLKGFISKVGSLRLASVVGTTLYFGLAFLPLYEPVFGYGMMFL